VAKQAIREDSPINTDSARAAADEVRPASVVLDPGAERKRRMSEVIARVAREDHDLLLKLAR
jgi:hypothetical protein